MIINHNLMGNNAIRNININSNNASNSMQKLSSGLRINKAGDDAAGLAISEKMRGQIRGLDQASSNSQDAISMIQTAEGALNETHSILQRMRELAVQSSTDTNTADDRTKIQGEVDQLAKEITRISNTTEFNTQNLLAGGLSDKFQIGANKGQDISFSINAMDAFSLGVADSTKNASSFLTGTGKITSVSDASRGLVATTGYKITVDATAAAAGAVSTDVVTDSTNTSKLVMTNGTSYTGDADATYKVKVNAVSSAGTANSVTSIQYSTDDGASWTTKVGSFSAGVTIDGMTFTLADSAVGAYATGDQYSFKATAGTATLQLNDGTNDIGQKITVHNSNTSAVVGDSSAGKTIQANFKFSSLADGTSTFTIASSDSSKAVVNNGTVSTEAVAAAGINVSSQSDASKAIETINKAITTVSQERSKMGAYQNRLEHTIANLGTASENLTSSESRIRDVDMAKEMSTFSKNNILSQAAQAMLAQANQQPQQVLQLLR